MTTFSPNTVGKVATRRSTAFPAMTPDMRPSCGTRRSAMLRSAMIFSLEISPDWMFFGERMTSCNTPSIRYRTRTSRCGCQTPGPAPPG